MRASNGLSEPRAASVASAPVTRAATNTRSIASSPKRQGRGDLRAVEQRQALLRTQADRDEAGLGERLLGRHQPAIDPHLADAQHGRAQVGQGGEVARSADRALGRNDRQDAALEHGRQ